MRYRPAYLQEVQVAVGCSVRQVTKVTETDYGEMEVTSLVGKETELDHQLDIIGVSWRGPGLCSSTDPKTLFQSGVGESQRAWWVTLYPPGFLPLCLVFPGG